MKRSILILLVIFFVLDQCIIVLHLEQNWRFLTKPLLMPILFFYYYWSVPRTNILFSLGLAMSFLGDLFLLFSTGFIEGLSSFLLAHILYILTFRQYYQKTRLTYIPCIIVFIISLFSFLYPHLGTMKIPVLLYAITIGAMLYFALGTKQKWLIIGALLFVLSDSILAINIFHTHSTISSLSVMIFYVLAQYCLTQGMIDKQNISH